MILIVNFTDACRLQGATLDGMAVEEWASRFALDGEKPIIRQPIDSLAKALLDNDGVFKVDIAYRLPHELDIRTNAFEPVCFVVGQSSGKLFGLNIEGRLIRLSGYEPDWERPVLTGVETGSLYSTCTDARVSVVIDELETLRRERIDVYRLIDEIDFSDSGFLRLVVSGLSFHLKVRARVMVDDMQRFVEFIMSYDADLNDAKCFDLRYDNMIICSRGDR
ncbi:MAG: hypothetical protein KOO62_02825 [candidate division Zixibacteria bacterium]|nr:hypothetical protein [candidate division Zixibacteria bacterium]